MVIMIMMMVVVVVVVVVMMAAPPRRHALRLRSRISKSEANFRFPPSSRPNLSGTMRQ
jgi:hypothetical protein